MVVVGPVRLCCNTNGTRSRDVSLVNGGIKRRKRSQGHAYRTDNVFGNYEYERRELHQTRPIFGTPPSTSLFERFEVCRQQNQWSASDSLNHLMCALTDTAGQLVWEEDNDEIGTAEELVKRLEDRFGSENEQALHRVRLSSRRQGPTEDLGTLVSDIRKLMTLAYPGKTTTHSEAFAVQSYISALLDRSLALSVAEREPKDLQQAYQLSLRLQAFRQAEADGNREANRNKPRVNTVKEAKPTSGSTTKDLEKRILELEKAANSKPSGNPPPPQYAHPPPPQWAWHPSAPPPPNNYTARRNGRLSRHARPEPRCWTCGGLDHVRAQCYRYRETQPKESYGYARPENRWRSTPATDHEQVNGEPAQPNRIVQPPVFARACWVPKEEPGPEEWLQTVPENWWEESPTTDIHEGDQQSESCGAEEPPMLEQTRETINDATIPTPGLEPITANELRDKGISTTSGVAYLELFLNGNPRRAIIDSGSQLSLVPENLISKRLIPPCKQKLVAVNGTEVNISGQTLLQCRLEEYGFEVPCVISPDIKETIFGLPWLLAQDVQWNVKAGQICLKGHWFPMQHTDWELSCRRVIVEESMTPFPSDRQPTLSEAVNWTTAQKAVASIELETKGSVNKRTPNRVRVKRKSRPRRSR